MTTTTINTNPEILIDKRLATEEDYLIQRAVNGRRTRERTPRQDMTSTADCQHLIDDYNKTMKSNGCVNGVTVNGVNGTNGDHTVTTNGSVVATDEPMNGFDRGFRPFKILGAKEDNGLKFLVMFREDMTKADLIPNHVLHQKCPQLLIKYYEKNTLWKRH